MSQRFWTNRTEKSQQFIFQLSSVRRSELNTNISLQNPPQPVFSSNSTNKPHTAKFSSAKPHLTRPRLKPHMNVEAQKERREIKGKKSQENGELVSRRVRGGGAALRCFLAAVSRAVSRAHAPLTGTPTLSTLFKPKREKITTYRVGYVDFRKPPGFVHLHLSLLLFVSILQFLQRQTEMLLWLPRTLKHKQDSSSKPASFPPKSYNGVWSSNNYL